MLHVNILQFQKTVNLLKVAICGIVLGQIYGVIMGLCGSKQKRTVVPESFDVAVVPEPDLEEEKDSSSSSEESENDSQEEQAADLPVGAVSNTNRKELVIVLVRRFISTGDITHLSILAYSVGDLKTNIEIGIKAIFEKRLNLTSESIDFIFDKFFASGEILKIETSYLDILRSLWYKTIDQSYKGTLLHICGLYNMVDTYYRLVDMGANQYSRDSYGRMALYNFCLVKDLESLRSED